MRLATLWCMATCALSAACSDAGSGGRHDTTSSAAGIVVTPAEFISARRYVGIRYDSLPTTFTFVSGSLIAPGGGSSAAAFDLDHVRTPRGEMVWLDSIVAVSPRGRPTRVVRAELKVPPLAADERLVMATCEVDGRLDPHVVAIVVSAPAETHYAPIRQAWRANALSRQFEVIPVTGIVCDQAGS